MYIARFCTYRHLCGAFRACKKHARTAGGKPVNRNRHDLGGCRRTKEETFLHRELRGGQFYQQLTYWEAAFLKCPTSPKKVSKKFLVAPSQKVARFISNSQIGSPAKQPASQAQEKLILSTLSPSGPFYVGLSHTVNSFISNSHIGKLLF